MKGIMCNAFKEIPESLNYFLERVKRLCMIYGDL